MILCLICQKLKASALPSPTCTTTRSRGFLGCKAIERISTWHKLLQETWMKHPFALKMTGTTKVLNWEPYQNFTNTVSSWSNAQKLLISSFPIWPPPVFDVASPVQDSRHSTGETCLKLWKFQVSLELFCETKGNKRKCSKSVSPATVGHSASTSAIAPRWTSVKCNSLGFLGRAWRRSSF